MLYNRQSELLYLAYKLERLGRVKIQKLQFLASINSDKPGYDFIPYNFGPYSLTLQNDLDYLTRESYMEYSDYQYHTDIQEPPRLPSVRKQELDRVIMEFGKLNSRDLMKIIYVKYPQFAVNSQRVVDLLSEHELSSVKSKIPSDNTPRLFTIGYEGKSLEKYLMLLFQNNVRMLVDVRASSYSMKKEFIGSRLASGCNLLNIEYLHLPELGIPNAYRKSKPDKRDLFEYYQAEMLPQRTTTIDELVQILMSKRRIALTCFEADHHDCHRHYLAVELERQLDKRIPVEHL